MAPRSLLPLHCSRICVSRDGRTKAQFSDNSILVLNASGSGFVHVQHEREEQRQLSAPGTPHTVLPPPSYSQASQPTITRQLSEYALSKHVPQLRVALEFRNMHLDQPFFCQPLLRREPRPQGISLGFLITELWWPCSAEDAIASGLVQSLPDGRIAVSTSDGAARMVLHHHRRRFAVCYPLLVQESPQEGKYHYVWHTQVFSTQDHPARWQPAVDLLLAISAQLDEAACTHGLTPSATAWPAANGGHMVHPQTGTYSESSWSHDVGFEGSHGKDISGNGYINASESGSAYGSVHHERLQQQQQGQMVLPLTLFEPSPPRARCTPLPMATQRGLSGTTGTFEPGSWWLEPTLTLFPPHDIIILEWTPSALYQFYPDTCEVEVWVSHDESCLASIKQGRYLRHFRCAQGSNKVCDQLYAASAVPESVWARPPLHHHHQHTASVQSSPDSSGQHNSTGNGRYPLGTLAAHALKLREQMRSLMAQDAQLANGLEHSPPNAAPLSPAGVEASFGVLSDRVIEHAVVPGQGSFTAYEDGRVRVMFEDRTILHLNAAQSHCKVFLPDGACLLVAVDSPVGIEPYMQAVSNFATWAFKTPEERAQCARMQAQVEAEVGAAQRMAKLLEAAVSHHTAKSRPSTAHGSSSSTKGSPPQRHSTLRALRPAPLEDESVPILRSYGPHSPLRSKRDSSPTNSISSKAAAAPPPLPPPALPQDSPEGPHNAENPHLVQLGQAGFGFHHHQDSQPGSSGSGTGSVQDMVERLLQENALLLQRLG